MWPENAYLKPSQVNWITLLWSIYSCCDILPCQGWALLCYCIIISSIWPLIYTYWIHNGYVSNKILSLLCQKYECMELSFPYIMTACLSSTQQKKKTPHLTMHSVCDAHYQMPTNQFNNAMTFDISTESDKKKSFSFPFYGAVQQRWHQIGFFPAKSRHFQTTSNGHLADVSVLSLGFPSVLSRPKPPTALWPSDALGPNGKSSGFFDKSTFFSKENPNLGEQENGNDKPIKKHQPSRNSRFFIFLVPPKNVPEICRRGNKIIRLLLMKHSICKSVNWPMRSNIWSYWVIRRQQGWQMFAFPTFLINLQCLKRNWWWASVFFDRNSWRTWPLLCGFCGAKRRPIATWVTEYWSIMLLVAVVLAVWILLQPTDSY